MSNPKGNPGNKGGGRKSAYQEKADAETLYRMYFDEEAAEELQQRIASGGKFSIKDRHMLTALEGDVRAINAIFAKVFPDKLNIKADKSISEVLDELNGQNDGQETPQQDLAVEPPLPNSEQGGETDTVQAEPSPEPLPPE